MHVRNPVAVLGVMLLTACAAPSPTQDPVEAPETLAELGAWLVETNVVDAATIDTGSLGVTIQLDLDEQAVPAAQGQAILDALDALDALPDGPHELDWLQLEAPRADGQLGSLLIDADAAEAATGGTDVLQPMLAVVSESDCLRGSLTHSGYGSAATLECFVPGGEDPVAMTSSYTDITSIVPDVTVDDLVWQIRPEDAGVWWSMRIAAPPSSDRQHLLDDLAQIIADAEPTALSIDDTGDRLDITATIDAAAVEIGDELWARLQETDIGTTTVMLDALTAGGDPAAADDYETIYFEQG